MDRSLSEFLSRNMAMIFQDPIESLNPRMTIEEIVGESLRLHGMPREEVHREVVEMLGKVGLTEEHATRYPHEFSGGQRQRIGIARAMIVRPRLIIADEPVSALDVSIQAQVINLLNDLKQDLGLTILFIAHNLSVVKYFSDRIGVMYFGKIVEIADSDDLYAHPLHPYTRALLSAIPQPNPLTERKRRRVDYDPERDHDYRHESPEMREVEAGHFVYCSPSEFERYRQALGGAVC
jgi:ABC-type oligopeptide transport system ATPase subunit